MMNETLPQIGLVVSYFGQQVALETSSHGLIHCYLHRNQPIPVVGDEVLWIQKSQDQGVISAIKPRRTVLMKGDSRNKKKIIAANLDYIYIVMAPLPEFSDYLIDRYLIAAELLELQPVLVLNKIDLLDGNNKNLLLDKLACYKRISYPIILTSVFEEEGLAQFQAHLGNKRGVLVGPSGVGKSSIIAKLSDEQSISIGDVSLKGTGKHTTTVTRLYHLTGGGELIDSPGVREFNLWPIEREEILKGFKEFKAYLGHCKFRDCKHLLEPNCAIKEAVASGKIAESRYLSYQKLSKSK